MFLCFCWVFGATGSLCLGTGWLSVRLVGLMARFLGEMFVKLFPLPKKNEFARDPKGLIATC